MNRAGKLFRWAGCLPAAFVLGALMAAEAQAQVRPRRRTELESPGEPGQPPAAHHVGRLLDLPAPTRAEAMEGQRPGDGAGPGEVNDEPGREVDQRRKDTRSAALTDWILLDGFAAIPDPQTKGDPKVGSLIDNKYQAQANLQNKDFFETQMQCVVMDVRPNGTLVIEGHGRVQLDEEEWELSLSGIIHPDDILPNKTIKSEKIAEKRILRRSAGHGRDGLRRGWFLRFWDRYSPF